MRSGRPLCVLLAACLLVPAVFAQVQPTITGINPSQGLTGTTVTINVSGTNLNLSPVVIPQFTPSTGLTLVTPTATIVSPSLVQVTVQIAATAPPGARTFALEFTTAGAGSIVVPSPTPFTITGAQAPALASVAPGIVAQGARHVQLTLLGTNFSPGAQVWISSPLVNGEFSAGPQATDFVVETVTFVNSRTLLAVISARPDATAGARLVNVVNPDGSNTGSNLLLPSTQTSRPLRVSLSSSLAAPLEAQTLAITHPRNGTVVTHGAELFAEAILAGAGSGAIVGEWLWDGAVVEQFSVVMTGGQSRALRTTRSLPTLYLGSHRLELRIVAPNLLQTRPVTVVVNPGDWSLQQLLAPAPGAAFAGNLPPTLRWAVVPGAARYQVGFASRPFLRDVQRWHNVDDTDWRVPQDVWNELPEGELYWTVRVVESSGVPRRPPPMRRLSRAGESVMRPVSELPRRSSSGSLLLGWQGFERAAFYRVSISRDADGSDIVRRYLTKSAEIDLWALGRNLSPGTTYYWRVEAYAADGRLLFTAAPHSFVAPETPRAGLFRRGRMVEVASMGGAAAAAPEGDLIVTRLPGPGDKVQESSPEVRVEMKQPVTPGVTALSIDDTDITGLAEFTTNTIAARAPLALSNGQHKVTLQVEAEVVEWSFTVDAPAPPPAPAAAGGAPAYQPGTDAEAETPAPAKSIAATPQPAGAGVAEMQVQIAANTQWVSGRDAGEEDTNVISIAARNTYRNGPWRFEENGSGLVQLLLAPSPRHALGRFNDYIFRLAHDGQRWGGDLRFGIVSPSLYLDSEFVTTATPREGVEPVLRTPAGSFGFYANTNDTALGGGAGVAFNQQILGAAYSAPLPREKATFRLMWLSAVDNGAPTTILFGPGGIPIPGPDPVAGRSAGDAYGGLFRWQFAPQWTWMSEYSWSYNNPDLATLTQRLFGRAWRSGITGSHARTTFSFMYRDVGPNFGNPANPSLSLGSTPDRRGVDSAVSQATKAGTFAGLYQFMQSDTRSDERPTLSLHNVSLSWSKDLTSTTLVGLQARFMRTFTGELPAAALLLTPAEQDAMRSDQRNEGLGASVMHRVGPVSLTFQASRDWFRNRIVAGGNAITTALNTGASWQPAPFFALQANTSVNWVASDPALIGTRRLITTYIQPMFRWQRTGLSVTPLITIAFSNNELSTGTLTDDTSNVNAGGRVTWQMPGPLRFSTLSLEGAQTKVRNYVLGTYQDDTRVLLLWNVVWGFTRGSNAGGR